MKKIYPCLEIDLKKIKNNAKIVNDLCSSENINIVGVSKVFLARRPIVKEFLEAGIKIIGDSRISNLKKLTGFDCEKMLLRIPMESDIEEVVLFSDYSLNSEIDTIIKIDKVCKKLGKIHKIILMIDLGDLREGILENDVLNVTDKIINLQNVKLIGIGTNLTCYGGVIPDRENLGKLIQLKKSIEDKYKINIEIISGGNSSSLYMVINKTIPEGINQLRIGEGIVLGRETSYGCNIPGCLQDAFKLKGEIIEMKEKPSSPMGHLGTDAFGNKPVFKDKGIMKRAILAVGRQDILINGLKPEDSLAEVIGASSDHLILDITNCKNNYIVGDILSFNLSYGALLASMTSPYVKKYYK
jgi:ornithine racemase